MLHPDFPEGGRRMNIMDMHCDTIYRINEMRRDGKSCELRQGEPLHINLEKLKKGDYLLQNFAAFVDLEECVDRFGSRAGAYDAAKNLVSVFKEEIAANEDLIRPMSSYEELVQNEKAGRISAMLTIEEGGTCCGEIEKLREFYQDGVRMLTLTWNYENEIGFPAAMQPQGSVYRPHQKREYGLKEFGIQFLDEMEQMGMIVDVSHLSDDGFFDVCEHAKRPFAASHSNARALCGHQRNLSDEMLRMLGERGGVSGLNLCPEFIIAEKNSQGVREHDGKNLLEYLAQHALHMMDVGGSGVVGLGTDFDGFGETGIPEDASRMQDFAWALHKLHVSDDRIDDILGGNVRRLYKEIL